MTTLSQQINKSTVVDPPHGFMLIENAVPEATWEILQTWIDSGIGWTLSTWLLLGKQGHKTGLSLNLVFAMIT
jgi:hypothetical protein